MEKERIGRDKIVCLGTFKVKNIFHELLIFPISSLPSSMATFLFAVCVENSYTQQKVLSEDRIKQNM